MLKKNIFILLFILPGTILLSQNKIITTRDTIYFSYAIKKNLIPDYQTLLNIIADSSYSENEVDAVINNKVKGSRETRIFSSENAIIEFDLKPGSDTNKSLGADKNVMDYLKLFFTNYKRSYENSVVLNVLSISPLKKTDYFYCNVLFECEFKNTTVNGESFKKFNRLAQIKFEFDKKWYPLITTISFSDGTELDTLNIYRDISKTTYDPEKLFQSYDDEKEKKNLTSTERINNLLLDGDILFEKEKYDEALNKYLEARKINYSNKEANAAVEKARSMIASQVTKQKAGTQRENHIAELKSEAFQLRDNLNFTAAKIRCDSLLKDYGTNDPEIKKLNAELSTLSSCLIGIESALEHNDLKKAVELCEKNIAETNNPLYKSDLYYHLALVYDSLDKSQTKKIIENLDRAIELSGKQHKDALKKRALNYMRQENGIVNAITDATQLISNDTRNAELYFFRGKLYEMDKSYAKSIEDFKQAINLNINDSTVYQKKSAIEFNLGKYDDAIKTCNEGISKSSCYGLLYFNRGISKNKLSDYKGAGDDFREALTCGTEAIVKSARRNISESYYTSGGNLFLQGNYQDANSEFTKSIAIDTNTTTLFMRAQCFLKLNKNDSALADLNALIEKNKNFPNAYLQRGIAYTNLKRYNEAMDDFQTETQRNKNNAAVWFAKGKLELMQKKYAEAATSFEFSATVEPSDSAWVMAADAHFVNNNFTKTIETAGKASSLNPKLQKAYLLSANSYYNKKQYAEAVKEFEKAIKSGNGSDEIIFNYATSLEADNDFIKASQNYDIASNSKSYQDTALFRSAICLVKSHSSENYEAALRKFNRLALFTNHENLSEVYAWSAYSCLLLDSINPADEYIGKSENANYNNMMLQYVYACRKTVSHNYAEAFVYLEKSLTDIALPKKYIEEEPLFDELRKNQATKERLSQLLEKYFKEK